MPDTRLILGGITFTDFEIPSKINFGGKQRMHIHKLVGGTRVVDALGPDPDPIKWSGRFRGANAISRARSLDRLRASGAQVSLTWGGLSYLVIVEHFKADYERFYEIPYEITCEVVEDGVGGLGALGIIGGLIGDIASGLQTVATPTVVQVGNSTYVAAATAQTVGRLVDDDIATIGSLLGGS